MQRLFLALWPEEEVRRRLSEVRDEAAARHPGRPIEDANLHITLVFLGAVDGQGRRCAEDAAGRVKAAPFTLVLDRLGYWRGPGVLWMGSAQAPDELQALIAALQDGLRGCGFDLDPRPFQPHITLLRKVPPRPTVPSDVAHPLAWPVTRFHLVESVTHASGAQYRIVATWPL